MSLGLYKNNQGLRFWEEEEILLRNQAIDRLYLSVKKFLTQINPAWRFFRVEGPVITPCEFINKEYSYREFYPLLADEKHGEVEQFPGLRPETTMSSFVYAEHLLISGIAKAPLCVWQAGKSFRQESNDGARASKLRFNEFYQIEFQCIFDATTTKADYMNSFLNQSPFVIQKEIESLTNSYKCNVVESDRLPSYSEKTVDVEVLHLGEQREMASISLRKDFPNPKYKVFEIAVGLDRIISMAMQNKFGIKL